MEKYLIYCVLTILLVSPKPKSLTQGYSVIFLGLFFQHINLTQRLCLHSVQHCNYSPVSLFNQMRFLYLHDMQHHPSINHEYCQWSIPLELSFLYSQSKNYNIMILYGCVNFMAESLPEILFFPYKWSFLPAAFHSVTCDICPGAYFVEPCRAPEQL